MLSNVQKVTQLVSCCEVDNNPYIVDSAGWMEHMDRKAGRQVAESPVLSASHRIKLVPGTAGYMVGLTLGEHIHHSFFSYSISP